MLKKSIIFIFILPLIITSIYSQNDSESDTIIINSINTKTHSGVMPAESISFSDAKKWAHNSSLTLLPDSPPVIDNIGFVLSDYQTVIPVHDYKKELMYKVFIDFFKYSESKLPFNSLLKIYIRDIYGNKRLAGTADLSYMCDKKFFEVSVPFDLSYPGRFDIIIQEYSDKTGSWGVWDIIVTSKKLEEIIVSPVNNTEKIKETEEKIFK